jgi:hypothetical protein
LGLLRLLAHQIGLLREALPIGGNLQPRSLITLELGFLSLQPAGASVLQLRQRKSRGAFARAGMS